MLTGHACAEALTLRGVTVIRGCLISRMCDSTSVSTRLVFFLESGSVGDEED